MDKSYEKLMEHYAHDDTLRHLMETIGMRCYEAGIRKLLWVLKRCWMTTEDYNRVMFDGTDCHNEDSVVELLTCYEEVDEIAGIVDRALTEGINFPVFEKPAEEHKSKEVK